MPVAIYWLLAGATVDTGNYCNSGNLGQALSVTANNLPYDGNSIVYIRLWYQVGSAWQFIDSTFIAGTSGSLVITAPSPGSTLLGTHRTTKYPNTNTASNSAISN